jgi:hypothetical protein
MFQPVIPSNGLGGWQFLQATYDRQLATLASSAAVKNETSYLREKLSTPLTVESFLNDRRLLTAAMTAFDLGGEAWKRGFIRKVLTEAATPGSNFLTRLNNVQYTRFAEAFRPVGGQIRLTAAQADTLVKQYDAAVFETAVGEQDNALRLALNYQSEIGQIARSGASDQTILYRLLGNVPLRTVLEQATGLPQDVRKIDIDKQATLLKSRLEDRLQVRILSDLAKPEVTQRIIRRFIAAESLGVSAGQAGPQSRVLGLYAGVGASASRNLFLSRTL